MATFSEVANCVYSTITTDLTAVATTIVVADATGFPVAEPYYLIVWDAAAHADPADDTGREIVQVTGRVGVTLTVVRGRDDTGAATHNTGDRIALLLVVAMIDEWTTAINAHAHAAGDGGVLDISDATNLAAGTGITLTDDTLSTNDGQIDHNALLNHVANEHIDWTNATDNLLTTGTGQFAGYSVSIVAKTAAYTATATDDIITCGAGDETFTVDLPAPATGKVFYIKNVGTGLITVDAQTTGGTTIDGQNTQTLNQYECIQVVSDGTVYWAI